jgi:starch synthase
MRVALLTREYPPDVYGGAGIHVAYLVATVHSLDRVVSLCEAVGPADANGRRQSVSAGPNGYRGAESR